MKFYHFNAPIALATNTFLLISDAGRGVIIDACAAPETYLSQLRADHASLALILQTHGHSDHTGSIEALRKATGARVCINAADAAQFGLRADRDLEDGDRFTVDELSFEVIATPGHTPGSVCIRCGSYLFTGDTLFAGDVGRTDLPGGSGEQLQHSLARLVERVKDDPEVLPGHEEFSRFSVEKQFNPWLHA